MMLELTTSNNNIGKWLIDSDFYMLSTSLSYLVKMHGDGISQHGNLNHASITQNRDNNIANVLQSGPFNYAAVTQH